MYGKINMLSIKMYGKINILSIESLFRAPAYIKLNECKLY